MALTDSTDSIIKEHREKTANDIAEMLSRFVDRMLDQKRSDESSRWSRIKARLDLEENPLRVKLRDGGMSEEEVEKNISLVKAQLNLDLIEESEKMDHGGLPSVGSVFFWRVMERLTLEPVS